MSVMGIGTNLLGYGHPQVDAAVSTTVAAGNMSTQLPRGGLAAERLVSLSMGRYGTLCSKWW